MNSVISVGSSGPVGFVSRSYQPPPSRPSNPWPKLARFVDSARSADAATNRGRPWSRRAMPLTHPAQAPRAARFGTLSPGLRHIAAG